MFNHAETAAATAPPVNCGKQSKSRVTQVTQTPHLRCPSSHARSKMFSGSLRYLNHNCEGNNLTAFRF